MTATTCDVAVAKEANAMDATETRTDPHTGLAEIDEATCWKLLGSRSVGRLAVTVGSHPDIFPVNYVTHRGRIVIHTEAGTKLAAAVLTGSVAFEVDEIDAEAHAGWSVVAAGSAREPATLEEEVEMEALDLAPWADVPKSRFIIITPERVTGRRLPGRKATPGRS
jgi:nitroimidazol reductase NimA-like FMN-containing flavoprotein (pyridoxamine 5'-phosphate oxidase superfamily)